MCKYSKSGQITSKLNENFKTHLSKYDLSMAFPVLSWFRNDDPLFYNQHQDLGNLIEHATP